VGKIRPGRNTHAKEPRHGEIGPGRNTHTKEPRYGEIGPGRNTQRKREAEEKEEVVLFVDFLFYVWE